MRVLAAMVLGCVMAGPAWACGGEGQRPCTVLERVPSCDKGLVEDFGKGKCVRPAGPAPKASCGGEEQRPCRITERVPSCDGGLVEDFARDRCVRTGNLNCGGKDQRPCMVMERVPSCDAGLAENFATNRCVTATDPVAAACGDTIRFVRTQASAAGAELSKEGKAMEARIASNGREQAAIQEAVRRLTAQYEPELRKLIAAVKEYAEPAHAAARGARDDAFCSASSAQAQELRRILEKHAKGMIERGAFTLSAAVEADAIAGIAATAGPVFAYDVSGSEQLGMQVSVQGQLITDIDVAGGAQIGWWPGAKLQTRPNTVAGAVGLPRDGLLSGPYMSAHVAASPEFLVEAEVALDVVFEIADFERPVTVESLLQSFSGLTVTVTVGLSALPSQANVGVAVGNTFTATLVDFELHAEPAKPAPSTSGGGGTTGGSSGGAHTSGGGSKPKPKPR
ncbi:MAG: hypothetical protein EP330_09130 [Deltaproteobacteria bacterium]|nr:MAG: hypothetical protein EP330_09130 [Deltaproteobacteria bacterium]